MSKQQHDVHSNCQHSSLCYSSWHNVTVADSKWIVKSTFSENSYEVMFSDFTSVWHEHLQSCDIEQRLKEINPSLEIDLSVLLAHIHNCLTECTAHGVLDVQYSSDMQLILTVTSKLSGLPFFWNFRAAAVSLAVVRHHLTEPLITIVSELSRQKQELFTILKNKDKEIMDLKAQGVNVSRKKLETALFDEASFNLDALQSKSIQSCVEDGTASTFSSDSQELYSEVMRAYERRYQLTSAGQNEERSGGDSEGPMAVSSSSNSPSKSPQKLTSEQTKEIEMERRLALEKRLAEEEKKESLKKKKKIKF